MSQDVLCCSSRSDGNISQSSYGERLELLYSQMCCVGKSDTEEPGHSLNHTTVRGFYSHHRLLRNVWLL